VGAEANPEQDPGKSKRGGERGGRLTQVPHVIRRRPMLPLRPEELVGSQGDEERVALGQQPAQRLKQLGASGWLTGIEHRGPFLCG
jgi:hypothetical protein